MNTIKYTTGDLLSSNQQALVNTVNLEGYMGKGIAYQFKKKFPLNNEAYIKACKNNTIGIGRVFAFEEDGKIIINFPTKDKWREKTKIEYIISGLISLKELIKNKRIKSIAIPPLGCGNGGLLWADVKPIIEKELSTQTDTDILIYEPSKNFSSKPKKVPKVTVWHYLLLETIMGLKLTSSMSEFEKELRIQKAIFLVNVFSKKEFFKFQEYNYGPYCGYIDITKKEIYEFLEHYGLKKTVTDCKNALNMMFKNIISKNSNSTMSAFKEYMPSACTFCNKVTDVKELEIFATIFHILLLNGKMSKDDIITHFKKYRKKFPENYSNHEITNGVDVLIAKKYITNDLLGYLSIS